MSETIPPTVPPAPVAPPPAAVPEGRSWLRVVLEESPYLIMLFAGFFGVSVSGGDMPNLLYWQVLTPIFGVLCIAAGWKSASNRGMRMRLIWTQAAHWAAFLAAMLLMFLPSVRGVVNDNGTEIALLLLLGLGTFVAGVHAGSWRIVLVGAVLGASVPTVATLQQSALLLTVAALIVAGIAAAFVFARARGSSAAA
ncbi:hypothetical protein KPL78_02100 [Roseomonas sp. HJA6]|uniref:Uncharacterized protein n=1 Tax=Roseomonas alba TaxID=2846776 RepID=A0ABS7A2T4_9PROT|nr:hypothetical protein [Neoroseomonas alba]MBW6396616.1 hypothetical protein [Neoroseomonas alba]